jgi:hypothetical protein
MRPSMRQKQRILPEDGALHSDYQRSAMVYSSCSVGAVPVVLVIIVCADAKDRGWEQLHLRVRMTLVNAHLLISLNSQLMTATTLSDRGAAPE